MKYKILTLADVHWGAMDADKQRQELEFIYEYLKKNPIDLLVIAGDYFDHRLLLNSKACLSAIDMFDRLNTLSMYSGNTFEIRMFVGTKSHDYDQLDALIPISGEYTRIFTKTTYEETLPGLHCLYCPDETMTNEEYINTYRSEFFTDHTHKTKTNDIMFFHGSFDVILKDIFKDDSTPNVVFEYSFFNSFNAVMIGGHWHDASEYGNVIYTRSPNRFKFNEDNPKGMVLLTYDTDNQTYEYERIVNPYTDEYHTYVIDTTLFRDMNDYTLICNDADEFMEKHPTAHIKFHILITDEKEINKSCIDSVKFRFNNKRNVKVVTENKLTKQRKEQKRKSNHEMKEKFSYLFDDSVPLDEKYRLFIKDTDEEEIDSEQIKSLLSKYI